MIEGPNKEKPHTCDLTSHSDCTLMRLLPIGMGDPSQRPEVNGNRLGARSDSGIFALVAPRALIRYESANISKCVYVYVQYDKGRRVIALRTNGGAEKGQIFFLL